MTARFFYTTKIILVLVFIFLCGSFFSKAFASDAVVDTPAVVDQGTEVATLPAPPAPLSESVENETPSESEAVLPVENNSEAVAAETIPLEAIEASSTSSVVQSEVVPTTETATSTEVALPEPESQLPLLA
jgi:hypothetical protein